MQPELSRRPDIDGLRGIAIIAVVGFHALPQAFPGGFVGVDVFFVLSGFLITSIIVSGLARGSFSFLEFYARRTRRIFPALIIVLAACLAVGWLDLLPGEYTALGKHTVAGATFLTNVVQWSEAGYFDPSAQSKPLLHLWSLGIEEQFYLAWPLVAFVVWRFGKKVFAAATIIVIVSFVICLKITSGHPVAAFYLPWSRAWELLLGGCVATIPPFRYPVYVAARNTAGVVGAVLIVSAIAMFDGHSVYPGWRAAVPTIGTALMLWAGSDAVLNRRLLKLPVMVGVGLISYPLYLWHWPILSYLWIIGDSTVATRVIGLAFSVALAWATYRYVELPMRGAGLRISIPLIGGISAIAVIGIAVFTGTLPANPEGAQVELIERAKADWIVVSGDPIKFKNEVFYREGHGAHPVLFIGDSNMQQYLPHVHDLISKDEGHRAVVYLTYGGCVPIPGVVSAVVPNCKDFAPRAFEFAQQSDAQTVVVAANWHGYFDNSAFAIDGTPLNKPEGAQEAFRSLQSALRTLTNRGKKVYLVLNIPIGLQFDPGSWADRSLFGMHFHPHLRISRDNLPKRYLAITRELERIAKDTAATTIDPYATLCDQSTCAASDERGEPIYKDGVHLRARFVRTQVKYLDRIFDDSAIMTAR